MLESQVVVKEAQGALGGSSRRLSRRVVGDLGTRGAITYKERFESHWAISHAINNSTAVKTQSKEVSRVVTVAAITCIKQKISAQRTNVCETETSSALSRPGTRESKCGDRRARISTVAVVRLLLRCDERQTRC